MEAITYERLIRHELDRFVESMPAMVGVPVHIGAVLEYIHANLFDEDLTVGDILDACDVRSHGFSARFKWWMVQLGVGQLSIRQYVELLRIHVAMRVLAGCRDVELSLVAFSIGYRHYETFNRAFARQAGVSPSQFRAAPNDGAGGGLVSE